MSSFSFVKNRVKQNFEQGRTPDYKVLSVLGSVTKFVIGVSNATLRLPTILWQGNTVRRKGVAFI